MSVFTIKKKHVLSTPLSYSTPSFYFTTPLKTLGHSFLFLHYTQFKKSDFLGLYPIPVLLTSHLFLSAHSLPVESAQNKHSSLSGVNRHCGRA